MTSSDNPGKPGPRLVQPGEDIAIPKPDPFASLAQFKVTRDPNIGGVAQLLTALPHHPIAQANDFVRLHPDRELYWSPALCFIPVPIKGQKKDTLHIISEEILYTYLPGGRAKRLQLALATKPHDVFFLCHVPTENLDNSWNLSNVNGCEAAVQSWVRLTSRKGEGVDAYLIEHALSEKAFPPPKWPKQSLAELIDVTFAGRRITHDKHPALLRLRGAEQELS
jgi:hypothetical protein